MVNRQSEESVIILMRLPCHRGRHHRGLLSGGAERTLAICRRYGIRKAILAKWYPSCDASGITGKLLRENGIEVINVF